MDDLTRTMMTLRCNDCSSISKVAMAGKIVTENERLVQIMHNGVKVVADGYHGSWMAHIIRSLQGHHEPQEELIFNSILRFVRHNSLMVELGSFWAYYTLWYLAEVPGARAICVEPDPNHMHIGQNNAELNGMTDRIDFIDAWVGGASAANETHKCESTEAERTLACLNMNDIIPLCGGKIVELLHIDAQGVELEFINSMASAVQREQVRFAIVSTHHSSISGSATTHQDCIVAIKNLGGKILAEHNVQESFSGDGLIAASFFAQDRELALPAISRNTARNSLFPRP
jgi:FkbM family methyltransferase